MTTPKRPLSINNAISLASVCSAAIGSARVVRLVDGYLIYGTARSIGDERGAFAVKDDDIRDCFLRVTLRGGFEVFWPVAELMDEVTSGRFVVNPDSWGEAA